MTFLTERAFPTRGHSASMTVDRKQIARIFKMRGLSIHAAALDALLHVLHREAEGMCGARGSSDAVLAIIDEIKERMDDNQNKDAKSDGVCTRRPQCIVSLSLLEEVVANLSRSGKDVTEEALQLLNAFQMPRLEYDPMRKLFTLVKTGNHQRALCGEPLDKVQMFSQRYALIQQRMLRQDIFKPKHFGAGKRGSSANGDAAMHHTLTSIESLLGRTGRKFLLGMIVQVEEGKYYLEDHTSHVPLNFSQASLLTDGFITENSIVLVEGEAIDGVLHVYHMGSPIVENRSESIQAIGLQNTDLFNSIGSISEVEKLRDQELQHGQEGMFVILSDVYLDSPSVVEKIDSMLEGYNDFQPLPIFIFMGNFSSKPMSGNSDCAKVMMSYFDDLANVICQHQNIAINGRFVFVPGPNDPGITGVLPRGPIPNYFTAALRTKVKHAIFASNPCRMRYFTKEIVFFRDDLVSKMRRHCLLNPRENDGEDRSTTSHRQLSRHAIKTVLDQGHLSPLPLIASPIFWQHDHALRLYPFPDALVLGDRVNQYYENYEECDVINPGPFSVEFNFVVYRPIGNIENSQTKSDVEFSQIERV